MPGEWDETTGIDEVDEQINPFMNRRRRPLGEAIDSAGAGEDDGVSHHINDDAHTNGRSGGPGPESLVDYSGTSGNGPTRAPLANAVDAGQPTKGSPVSSAVRPTSSYEDPGKGHLADLIAQQQKMQQPAAKPGIGHRLLQALADSGPTIAASAMGSAGGAVGADQRMEKGIERRHAVADKETESKRQQAATLKSAIEQEQHGEEQRTFQHGEDQEKLRVQEEGMNSRARLAEAAEDARSRRQAALFGHQDQQQQGKFQHDEEMEDQKQVGRMQLAEARRKGAESVARIRASAPTHMPPVLSKSVDAFENSQSRLDVMQKSYDAAIADPGNQQAQLNLLSNHMGMTMGLQQGARITQALVEEAKRSGYLDERIEAHFGPDGFMTGVVLSPRQMSQMMTLARERIVEDSRKVNELEGYFGVQGKTRLSPRIPPSNSGAGAGNGGGAQGGAGAASGVNSAPKTAEEYLRKRKQSAAASTSAP